MPTMETFYDAAGARAFVLLTAAEYDALAARAGGETLAPGTDVLADEPTIPHAVVMAMSGGATAARAWREHLELTQAEVAERMGITQSAYAQTEAAEWPRKPTREKLAGALGIVVEQLVRGPRD